jgi:hypothetical protein
VHLDLLSSHSIFFLLLLSSLTLPISAFHASILSEVWLQNLLRLYKYSPVWFVCSFHCALSVAVARSINVFWSSRRNKEYRDVHQQSALDLMEQYRTVKVLVESFMNEILPL